MINIRQAKVEDAAFIWQVQSLGWQETYKEFLSHEFLGAFAKRDGVGNWQRTLQQEEHTIVVMQYNGADAGFAVFGENKNSNYPYDHELYAMYVLKQYQQHGLGKAIIRFAKQHLQTDKLIAWTLTDNPSNLFYRKTGRPLPYQKEINLGGKLYSEYAFEL